VFIQAPGTQTEDDLKEIKVRIPTPLHWKLHTLKLAAGQQISTTVRDALALYFGDVFPDAANRARV